ncbi:MAG: GAF domain-containing protein [bacterium]|jgi:GAF domain-containing protein|nr:GAF domain-containing protein [bacterium]
MTAIASVESFLVIADIARTLNDFRPLEETLDQICDRVSGLSGYDCTAIFLPGDGGEALEVRGSSGMSPAYAHRINVEHPIRIEPDSGGLSPTAQAFSSGRPVTISDVEADPGFEPWREGARLQGYRSLACSPVILRSQVIGVLNCYGSSVRHHSAQERELLQLVARLAGVAIETARAAEKQRRTAADLRELSEQLQAQNRELTRLSSIQARLTEQLANPDALAVERTARVLSEITERAVLVAGTRGSAITYAGPPERRAGLERIAAQRDAGDLLRARQLVRVEDHTLVRIGVPELLLGWVVLHPALEDDRGTPTLATIHAAAVLAAELEGARADRALETHARPALLLALAHGLYGAAQLQEAAGVLGVPADVEVRLVLVRCASEEAAHRLAKRRDSLNGAGWPLLVACADGRDALALCSGGTPTSLCRAAERLRERHPEVELIGVSAPAPGLLALSDARRQAQAAAAVNDGRNATLFEDLGTFGALAGELAPGRAEQLVRDTLGALLDHDAAHGTRLVDTLAAYVEHGGRAQEAAAALHIHPNTLHQRLRRAADLGGFDLHDYRALAGVVLGLEWNRMSRARSALER